MPIVYKITCLTTGQLYFGWTTYTLAERFSKHSRNYRRGNYFARCIRKYGADNFIAEVLHEFGSNAEAIAKEVELIAIWKTNMVRYPDGNGMNMTDGGEGTEGYRHNVETKRAIRKASTGRKRSAETQAKIDKLIEARGAYWTTGRKASEATRRKQSDALKKAYATGVRKPRHDKHTEETKMKMSLAHLGRTKSVETREKMSMAQRGKKLSNETKQRLREINTGKKQSPETIEKRMSKIRGKKQRKRTTEERARVGEHFRKYYQTHTHPLLGKKMSAESRAKMRASRLAYIEKQKAEQDAE